MDDIDKQGETLIIEDPTENSVDSLIEYSPDEEIEVIIVRCDSTMKELYEDDKDHNYSAKKARKVKTKESHPLACPYCKQSYASTSLLNRHVKKLHQIGEYYCNICSEKFNTFYERKIHCRKVCYNSVCPVCFFDFQRRQHLNRHIATNKECRDKIDKKKNKK